MPSPWRKMAVQVKERAVKILGSKMMHDVSRASKKITAFIAPHIQGGHEVIARNVGPHYTRLFKHYARPAVLRLREFFAFSRSVAKPYKKEIAATLAIFTIVSFISGVIMVRGAAADRETHAFIFPARVSGEGFENPESSAAQELGQEAFFADFTATSVAARVSFSGAENPKTSPDVNGAAGIATGTPSSNASDSPEVDPILPVPASVEVATSTASDTVSMIERAVKFAFPPKVAMAHDSDVSTDGSVSPSAPAESETPAPVVQEVTAPIDVSAPADASSDATTAPVVPADASSTSTSDAAQDAPQKVNEPRESAFKATCTLMNRVCHILTLEGFGVASPLSNQVFRGANLKMSIAHRADAGINDRIIVRAYKDGEWQYIGEYRVSGNSDNAMRGGYYSLALPISNWSDLTDLTLSIEYSRESEVGNAVAYIDAAWIDTSLETQESIEDLSDLSPNVKAALIAKDEADRLRMRDHLAIDDETSIDFTHPVLADGATLRIAFATSSRAVLGRGEEYVSVTNVGKTAERVHLNFHLPQNGGRIEKLEHFAFNIADKKVTDKTSPVAYLCSAGWVATKATVTEDPLASSTLSTEASSFACASDGEVRSCASFNDDKTNCYAESVKIGEEEETVYRRGWEEDAVTAGSFRDDQGIFAKAIESLTAKMPQYLVPGSVVAAGYALPIDLEPGATRYFRVRYSTPMNARGDLYVEAAAASGNFGLGSTEFEGSWNWRIPADIAFDMGDADATSTDDVSASSTPKYVTFSLGHLSSEFWSKVKSDGGDIRFTDEEGLYELPYTLVNFSKVAHVGKVTLRLPAAAGIMPRVYLYLGDADASLPRDELLTDEMGGATAADADALWGMSEFVIPGEHRKFDVDNGRERAHINRLLSKSREFAGGENPTFSFQYKPQTSGTLRAIRKFFGAKPFTVDNVRVKQFGREVPVRTTVTYGDNLAWSITIDSDDARSMVPGRAELLFTVHEGGKEFEDGYDFEWGLLAINANKATFERGEVAKFSMGALSETGDTVCDAHLKFFITSPASTTSEIPVEKSGKCNGNNLTDVPDYTASLAMTDSGDYLARLVRLDENGAVLSEVHDIFHVVNRTPFVIERSGPTRINPKYPYTMTIKLAAREDFAGDFVERVPSDFIVTQNGGAATSTDGASMSLTWNMNMKAGENYQLTYEFDAPDKSPYIYFAGPASIGEGEGAYVESRKWQIASDAAGKMLIYWTDGASIPAGWDCLSCAATSTFYQRYVMASSTFGVTGGSATHTHTFTTTVSSAIYGAAAAGNTTGNQAIYKDHAHGFTPAITTGSNLPLSQSLRLLRAQAAGDVSVPVGATVFFETVPASGWTTLTSYEGYFPVGDNAVGSITGSTTHSHVISGATGAPSSGAQYSASGGSAASDISHTHTLAGTSTIPVSNNPPYYTLRLARSTGAGLLPNDAIAMWDNTPAAGWLDESVALNTALSNRFVQVASVAGSSGGNSTHTHDDLDGVILPASAGSKSSSGSAFLAPASHYHTANFSSFTTASNTPPYVTAIFAKREVGVADFTQLDYRFYANVSSVDPIDPWPTGPTDLAEDIPITDVSQRIKPASVFRVRMNMLVSNATATLGTRPLKLQYATTSSSCAAATVWRDVGAAGSTTAIRGYDNTLVSDNALVQTPLLSTSTPGSIQGYEENGKSSSGFVRQANQDTIAEWDWSLQAGANVAASSQYCLRMVDNSGAVFSNYSRYPQLQTNTAPIAPSLSLPFAHAKVNATTPTLKFYTSDAEGDPLDYRVQISTDPTFASTAVDMTTLANPGQFSNSSNPSNYSPFNSGDTISFAVPSGKLTNGSTYWWRIAATDQSGSTQYGSWSGAQAFTVDTAQVTSAWFQTTDAQFAQDSLTNATTTGTGGAKLTTSSIAGTVVSPDIDFEDGSVGTVWGDLTFTQSGGPIKEYVEYKDAGGNWLLVPDALISGNSGGLSTSPTSLRLIDPNSYPTLRVRVEMSTTSAPTLSDWGVTWDYKTLAPTITSPFSHQKLGTLTPSLYFSTTNPQNHTIIYEVEYSTSSSFATSTICRSDDGNASIEPAKKECAGFTNVDVGSNLSPFTSGNHIRFTFPSNLTNNATYFWRMRGMDSTNSVWSFYTDVNAFTIDTSLVYTTWFQDVQGQWNMDTLSGVYADAAGNVQVSTTSDRVLIAYGKGTDPFPKYRIYQSGTLSAEKSMLSIGATPLWIQTAASPANDQFIVGTQGADKSIYAQVYENGTWSDQVQLTASAPSDQRRSFDIAYQKDGKALAVWCSATNAQYMIFDGASWGSAQTLTLGFSANCELVKLASSPTQNQILALFRDTGSSYYAFAWDGVSTWGNKQTFGGTGAFEPQHDGMAIEYEKGSGKAVAVIANGATQGFRYRVWSGSNWTGSESAVNFSAAAAKMDWAIMRRDPASNDMYLCAISQYADTDDGAYTEHVRWNSASAAWVATKEGQYYPYTRHAQSNDCIYETKTGRTGKLLSAGDESWSIADGSASLQTTTWDSLNVSANTWQSGISDLNRRWNGSGTTYNLYPGLTWTALLARAANSGDILGLFLDAGSTGTNPQGLRLFKWDGSTWTTLSSPMASIGPAGKPFGQPFDMASQDGLLTGRIYSSAINFADGNAPSWQAAYFTSSQPASTTAKLSVEYMDTNGAWNKIPDTDLANNSVGTTTGPIDLKSLNVNTYATIRLRADLTCASLTSCPTVGSMRAEWTNGLPISGTIKQWNRSTNVTSGTVNYAINGVAQGGSGTIAADGSWSIPNANYKSGDIVTVWVNTATDARKAGTVVKFAGAGQLSGLVLYENWLTIGAPTQSGQTITNTDIAKYDATDEAGGGVSHSSLQFNVDSSLNLSACGAGTCGAASVYVSSNTTWQPRSSGGTTNTTYNLTNDGTILATSNTFKVAGDWKNTNSFNWGTSNVVFNATSSVHSIDSTGASLYKFNNVTFGEAATSATWSASSTLYAVGNLAINYGAVSPTGQNVSVEGNLSIGTSGLYAKGSGTLTLLGSSAATWSDLTAAGQDMGTTVIDGAAKVITLAGSVKASTLTVGLDDTLSMGVYTVTMLGNFTSNGTIVPGSGTLQMASSGPMTINQGSSSLGNLTLKSGTTNWIGSVATTTGDVTVQGGSTTFPPSLIVGGSFVQTGGAFTAAATTTFNSSSAGKTIGLTNSLASVVFSGSGSWSFSSAATSTGSVFVNNGSVTLPSTSFAVAGDFVNSGSLVANGGTLVMSGAGRVLTPGTSNLGSLSIVSGATTLTTSTSTFAGSVTIASGATFSGASNGQMNVGGSFTNSGTLNVNGSELVMNGSGSPQFRAGTTTLTKLTFSGSGNYSMFGSATTTGDLTITSSVGGFTYESGKQLNVGGYFGNSAAIATTWTGTTLRLYNGGTYAVNTKGTAAQSYNALVLDNNTQLRVWNASASSVTTNGTSSLYAMNWGNVSGALRIYGTYGQTSGSAYWDYATDFDGTSASRPVSVSLASGASVSIAPNATLEVIGTSTASTSVTAISGSWNMSMSSSTWKSQYADWSGMSINGIVIGTSTDIAQLSNSKFTIASLAGSKALAFDSSTITSNSGEQYVNVGFASTSAVMPFSVTAPSTPGKFIRFKNSWGTLSGESYDSDSGDPGEVRWDDSNIPVNITGQVYSDGGVTKLMAVTPVTIRVTGASTSTISTSTNALGVYTFNNVPAKGETTMTVFLDTNGGTQGAVVTRSASVDISNLDIYANRVILRHEDTLPMTTAVMAAFDKDNTSPNGDTDVGFASNGGVFTTDSALELYVWPGKTFEPGGDVTTSAGGTTDFSGRVRVSAGAKIRFLGSETFKVAGGLSVAGSIDAASSTISFTNNSGPGRAVIASSTLGFYNFKIDPAGLGLAASSSIRVDNDLFIGAGTLTGAADIDYFGRNATGTGRILFSSSTATMFFENTSATTTLGGGSQAWTFGNVDVKPGVVISRTGTGVFAHLGSMNLEGNSQYMFGASSIEFNGAGNPIIGTGALDLLASGTVRFMPTSGNVLFAPGLSFGNIVVGGAGTTTLSSATTTVRGNLTNSSCSFEHNNGAVLLAGGGSKTINFNCSSKYFNTVVVDDPTGTWTMPNHFRVNNFYLNSAASFSVGSGVDFHVAKDMKIHAGDKTTWSATSNLFTDFSGNVVVNDRTDPGVQYGRITLSAGSSGVFWNSSSTAFTLSSGGAAFYDASGIDGRLDIVGNYVRNSGEEDWSNATDFDGTGLGVGSTRPVGVYFASGATAVYGGTSTINIVGATGATTTIQSLSGTYGLTIGGSTSTIAFADFNGMNASGVSFANSVAINAIDDSVFRNPGGAGSMITMPASVITANPLKVFRRDGFIAPGGANVNVSGVTATIVQFTQHYGGRDGEAYDTDPGGDPGYVKWDDSAAQISITGHLYKQDGSVSAICNGVTQSLVLVVDGATSTPRACAGGTGTFTFSNINYLPTTTLAVYVTGTTTKAVTYAYQPITNISNFDVRESTVTVRNEQSNPITEASIASFAYDPTLRPDILASISSGAVTMRNASDFIVWTGKTYTPSATTTLAGNVYIQSGANIGGTSVLDFQNAATKTLYASSTASIVPSLRKGSAATTMALSGLGNVNGSIIIDNGTLTLPTNDLAITGSFVNNATFNDGSGTTTFTGGGAATIKTGTSKLNNLIVNSTGSYAFTGNATTTNFTITKGSVILPSSFIVQGDFVNAGGSFTQAAGTTTLTGAGSRTIAPGGSTLASLVVSSGNYTASTTNMTLSGDLNISSGATVKMPSGTFTIGGSLQNSGAFTASATSTQEFNATSIGKVIAAGTSTFGNLLIDGVGGGWTAQNATSTGSITITTSGYVQSPSSRLVSFGVFTNSGGGTWTNSTLRLATSTNITAKGGAAAVYGTLELDPNVTVKSWNAGFATVTPQSGASLYAMNAGNVSGALNIYGSYTKTSGTDYWSATTDFDGAAVGARAVNVKFASNSSAIYSTGAGLQAVGTSGQHTSVSSLSGVYTLKVQDGTFKSQYSDFANMDASGVQMRGSVTIANLDNSSFVASGTALTIDSSAVDQNASSIFTSDSFTGTTTNVTMSGSTANSVTFTLASGVLSGEALDSDGDATGCGAIRFDDSNCQIIEQYGYRFRADDGGEAASSTNWYGGSASSWTTRERVAITNNTPSAVSGAAVKVALPFASGMRADYADIVFTDSGGTTTIPFWIEKYDSAQAFIWVKTDLPANGVSDVYAYYGNASAATSAMNGSSTFAYFDDFTTGADNYSGEAGLFNKTAVVNDSYTHTGSYMLTGVDGKTNGGIYKLSPSFGQNTTIRSSVYVNVNDATMDNFCTLFGVQSSGSNNAACIRTSPSPDGLVIGRDEKSDGLNDNPPGVSLSSGSLSGDMTTGWYELKVDWRSGGNIVTTLYNAAGTALGSVSATDNTYASGGVGFSFLNMKSSWGNIRTSPYIAIDPTVKVLVPQGKGGASWIAAENTAITGVQQGTNERLRFSVRNTGTAQTGLALRLDYAQKLSSPTCAAVPQVNYTAVPTAASCGASGVCMRTSPVLADGAATTPLLSSPKNISFVGGKVVTDPNNITSAFDVPTGNFTEVEYAIRITNSAMGTGYCFRVSKNGTALDSYSRIAEIGLFNKPQFSNWFWNVASSTVSLVEGTTTSVSATGTVTDFSGYADINPATLSGVFRRSGVAGGDACTNDPNNCYANSSTTCSLSNCSGNTCTVSCSAKLYYFAEPTDVGSVYAGQTWNAYAQVANNAGSYGSSTDFATLNTLKALQLSTSTIDYGSVDVGSSTGSFNPNVGVLNTGNTTINPSVAGTDLTAAGSAIASTSQKVASSTFNVDACAFCVPVANASTLGAFITKQVSIGSVMSKLLYFGLQVPLGTKALTHNGTLTIMP